MNIFFIYQKNKKMQQLLNASLEKKMSQKWQTTVNKHDERAGTPQDLLINSRNKNNLFLC